MDERPLLLIVEDDDALRGRLARAFELRGFEVVLAATGAEAETALARETPEFVILDLRIAGASGLDLIPRLIQADPATRIVVLTGYGSIATAVEAVRRGGSRDDSLRQRQRTRHRSDGSGRRRSAGHGPAH
jgi:two-component system response regulator RegA